MGNPFLGVFFHWLGGLASGSFYVPYRFVRKWSWEVYWLAGGFFSWIFAPWIAALLLTNGLFQVLQEAFQTQSSSVGFAFLFGMMWGMGGLTFGLTMRYLGMSLGMAVALGYCTVFGTIMPPLFKGEFFTKVCGEPSGIVILFGVGICILGIVIAALAGMSKEREMSEDAKKAAIKEFSFVKGLLVATFSGIMSAGMAYGMAAATPIGEISLNHGTEKMWSELPRLCVILAGGFVANFLWCAFLFMKNRTGKQFFAKHIDENGRVLNQETIIETATDAPAEEMAKQVDVLNRANGETRVPMFWNYVFCAIAGTTWYLQFFFYSMGESQMGAYQFSSWPLHMASIMIFSSLWGLALKEWKGSSGYTKTVLFVTLTTLIFSTIVMGYGTHMGKMANEAKFTSIVEKIILEGDAMAGGVDKDSKAGNIVTLAGELAKFGKPIKEKGEPEQIVGLVKDVGVFDPYYLNPLSEEGKSQRKIDERVKKMTLLVRDIATYHDTSLTTSDGDGAMRQELAERIAAAIKELSLLKEQKTVLPEK